MNRPLTTFYGVAALSNEIELSVKKQKEVKHTYEGTIKPKAGQTVWEIVEDTGEIEQAKYKSDTATSDLRLSPLKNLLSIRAACTYRH